MMAPSGAKVTQDQATAHNERLPILELEEIHPIGAVTRQITGPVMDTSLPYDHFWIMPDRLAPNPRHTRPQPCDAIPPSPHQIAETR